MYVGEAFLIDGVSVGVVSRHDCVNACAMYAP